MPETKEAWEREFERLGSEYDPDGWVKILAKQEVEAIVAAARKEWEEKLMGLDWNAIMIDWMTFSKRMVAQVQSGEATGEVETSDSTLCRLVLAALKEKEGQ